MTENIPNSIIPPRVFSKPKKLENEKFRALYMDAFETEALHQFNSNVARFHDFYRMCDNSLSYVELKDYAPSMEFLGDALNELDIPTNIYHHDLLGRIINSFVGKLADLEDKFFITDTGEISESEFIGELNSIIEKDLTDTINESIYMGMVKEGINPDSSQEFASEEEQQAHQQRVQQIIQKSTPQGAVDALKANFKTIGVRWAEATLEKDREFLKFDETDRELFKHYLLTGTSAKITKIINNTYKTFVIDSRKLFHSKDIGEKYLANYEYAGWMDYLTPDQVVEIYGEYFSAKQTEEILGGKDGKFKDAINSEYASGSVTDVVNGINFKRETQPFMGYRHKKYMEHIEDMSGLTLGYRRKMNTDGSYNDVDSYITRNNGVSNLAIAAEFVDSRYDSLPKNVAQVTEVYFRGYEYIGYLYYLTEEGFPTMEQVTKDISPDFIKENEIREIYNDSVVQAGNKEYLNTIVWQYRPYVYRGVKIRSSNMSKPLYPIFEKMEMQISDTSDADVKLPISGVVGKGIATGIEPFQMDYNVYMNQIRQLVEKELGMFYTVELESLPTELRESGDVEDVLMRTRNMAKSIGLMAVSSNLDDRTGQSDHRNMFGIHNVSHAPEINTRIQLAEYAEGKAYQAAGLIMQKEMQDTKYSTAEGIKMSNETMSNQIAHIFEDFNSFLKEDRILHLNIAQFLQMFNYDKSIYYTKSDGSLEWLKVTKEHKIPWRSLGLTVTDDSRKKKAFTELRQYIMSQNTLGADLLSLGKVITANNISELLQAGSEERTYKQEQEAQRHQNQMAEVERANQMAAELAQLEEERREASKDKDRKVELDKAYIQSMGRVSDDQNDPNAYKILTEANKLAQKNLEMTQKERISNREFELKELVTDKEETRKDRRLELEERKLDIREKALETNKTIASINKN